MIARGRRTYVLTTFAMSISRGVYLVLKVVSCTTFSRTLTPAGKSSIRIIPKIGSQRHRPRQLVQRTILAHTVKTNMTTTWAVRHGIEVLWVVVHVVVVLKHFFLVGMRWCAGPLPDDGWSGNGDYNATSPNDAGRQALMRSFRHHRPSAHMLHTHVHT